MSPGTRGVLIFAAASVGAGALIVLARRVLRDSPRAAAWATGAILGGACFAASMLSFAKSPSAFDWFGVSAISLTIWLSFVSGALRLAADRKVASEVSIVVFKLSGDDVADLRRGVEIMSDLAGRLRGRGLTCSDPTPLKPVGAGIACGSFTAALDFGPSPGTLSIACERTTSKGPPMEERVRPLREVLAADERFTEQRWMSPSERDRLVSELS